MVHGSGSQVVSLSLSLTHTQIIVNDVHIRYEEVLPDGPFTVGALLENISAQSTDEDWVRM